MTAPANLASTLDLIGNTPMVLLKGPSEEAAFRTSAASLFTRTADALVPGPLPFAP